MRNLAARFAAATITGLLSSLVLAGCGMGSQAISTTDTQSVGEIKGILHGGQQAIVGAHVYLFAAGTSSYAGKGIAASTSNASQSLLKASATGFSDSVGAYVLSGSYGQFSITDDYTCTAGQSLYLYAQGGNSGAGENPGIGELAALGICPSSGTLATQVPFVYVDEVSTIAAAYALAGFATDSTHISAPTASSTLATTGLHNAFLNVPNILDIATGTALSKTPNGNGTVPADKMNLLADIIASCINSISWSSEACTVLLNNALASGSTGSAPTDTATAAINIAHYPANAVSALFGLQTSTPPYVTSVNSAPNDFSLAVTYSTTPVQENPVNLALDASGNVWIPGVSALLKLSPQGVDLSNGGFTGSNLNSGNLIAIGPGGNVWVTNGQNASLSEFDSQGNALTVSSSAPTSANGLSFDTGGNLWVSTQQGSSYKLNASGALLSGPFTGGGQKLGSWNAIDSNSNLWIANGNSTITELSSTGSTLSGSGFGNSSLVYINAVALDASNNAWFTDQSTNTVGMLNNSGVLKFTVTPAAVNSPLTLAIDGAGNAWIGNTGNTALVSIDSSGNVLTPSSGILAPLDSSDGDTLDNAAIDGSGNVWGDSYNGVIVQFLGLATPVATPILPNQLGARP
ncbi:MAG: hypothetical protein PW735_00995 [Acidobacteriaceae bacterium]|nr:hypothetical protein [Acidobacteriaceae bacterium]